MAPVIVLQSFAPIVTVPVFSSLPNRLSLGSPPHLGRGFLFGGKGMNFTLIRAEYDQQTERAYVELRAHDDDGGDLIATAIFSFHATAPYSKHETKQDIIRKARHLFRRAAVAT
jgi:hypothetical protein